MNHFLRQKYLEYKISRKSISTFSSMIEDNEAFIYNSPLQNVRYPHFIGIKLANIFPLEMKKSYDHSLLVF